MQGGAHAVAARAHIDAICAPLDPVVEVLNGHVGYLAKKKRFLWLLDDHHGDGRVSIAVKCEGRDALLAAHPSHAFVPPYLGKQGWLGFYLDVEPIDWELVGELVTASWSISGRAAAKKAKRRAP